jgi:hypothetical protein
VLEEILVHNTEALSRGLKNIRQVVSLSVLFMKAHQDAKINADEVAEHVACMRDIIKKNILAEIFEKAIPPTMFTLK